MNYEIFQKKATLNSEFEIIPSKIKLLAEGIITDKNGYMKYEGQTYKTNIVKLNDLPAKLQHLFTGEHMKLQKYNAKEIQEAPKEDSKLESLSKILFEQLQNIVDPEENTDMSQELKKANTVCNVANKIINIADLSLKAEALRAKMRI